MFTKLLSSLFEPDSQIETPKTKSNNISKLDTKTIVEQIHRDFNTEVNRILQECNITLESEINYKSIIEKAEVMKSLGFTSTKTANISDAEQEKINKAKADLEALHYFQNKYPLYKFITRESIHKLCDKYNLYFVRSQTYKGDIPDKNLREIQNFKIDKVDTVIVEENSTEMVIFHRNTPFPHNKFVNSKLLFESPEEISKLNSKEKYKEGYCEKQFWIIAPLDMIKRKSTYFHGREETSSRYGTRYDKEGNPIPDPIVVKPVAYKDKEYFLIVSAWGQEASDELVVNHKMN